MLTSEVFTVRRCASHAILCGALLNSVFLRRHARPVQELVFVQKCIRHCPFFRGGLDIGSPTLSLTFIGDHTDDSVVGAGRLDLCILSFLHYSQCASLCVCVATVCVCVPKEKN
ncbi:hypothetical protein FOZ60_000337 [Perkinsus olseni]|uniref:Uncharacterized protein n=1 Tax=Perkinsus olseni TaxID=32597 RepID=A0A7J6MZS6_PEROL|nr:hypothetical protein FOZ60_000337 [Perkinsus olseni]